MSRKGLEHCDNRRSLFLDPEGRAHLWKNRAEPAFVTLRTAGPTATCMSFPKTGPRTPSILGPLWCPGEALWSSLDVWPAPGLPPAGQQSSAFFSWSEWLRSAWGGSLGMRWLPGNPAPGRWGLLCAPAEPAGSQGSRVAKSVLAPLSNCERSTVSQQARLRVCPAENFGKG